MLLAQNGVHGAMAGYTGFSVGLVVCHIGVICGGVDVVVVEVEVEVDVDVDVITIIVNIIISVFYYYY